ncbi:MAG: VWA domain-containing protein [Spirochaetia bacterium]|nr:VWA domain-containing protein [Spirochaetia bacterium]
MKIGLLSYLLLFLLLACGAATDGYSKEMMDVILVLDTSLSMVGSGGANIMSDVKQSIYHYIDSLEDGDRVTFATFDTKLRIYPSVILDDANDRDIVKKYISVTPAEGLWTHTYLMLDGIFAKAEELQRENDNRRLSIVVMTDGIDDPPPASADKINITDISTKYEGKDWWIYMVDYQQLKSKTDARRTQLEKGLKQVSDKSVIVDATEKPSDSMNSIMDAQKAELEKAKPFPFAKLAMIIGIIILIALLIALIKYLTKKHSQLKVRGILEYWNNDMIKPYIEKFDMTKFMLREILIGNRVGCQLKLRELELKEPFKIVATRHNREVRAKILSYNGAPLEFVNGTHGEVLENGEVFRAGNFMFRYLA